MSEQPKVSKSRTLSPVWFIPLLALVIAGWLAVRAWQERGPEIQIEFSGASGIEVGSTKIRYRDVEVGTVKQIQLSEDFNRVVVTAEMDAYVSPLINDQSNFWVVSPRVSRSGVSGIETLLSGVYIEMDSGGEGVGESQSSFIGLEEPPSVRSYDKGSSYLLVADTLGSLDIGSPVLHREVPVGEVTGYKLLTDQSKVQIRIFVKDPFDDLIREHSQFWNVSGLGATIGLEGVELDVASLSSLIAGGVEFDTPPDLSTSSIQADPGRTFYLFANRDAVSEGAISVSYPFLLRFTGSVRGLKVGAPVEYLGIQVGRVEHIALDYERRESSGVNVLIAIQPERMGQGVVPTKEQVLESMDQMVAQGMKARLSSGSLIGGSLFVDLVPDAGESGNIVQSGDYPVLPTSDNEFSQLTRQLNSIMDKVQSLPIEEIGEDLKNSLKGLRSVIGDLEDARLGENAGGVLKNLKLATDGLDGTVDQLERTLRSLDQTVAPDSALSHTLTSALDDIADAAKSMEQLTDQLQRYPDALLRGREEDKE